MHEFGWRARDDEVEQDEARRCFDDPCRVKDSHVLLARCWQQGTATPEPQTNTTTDKGPTQRVWRNGRYKQAERGTEK
jgi:hypothetical protein